MYRNSVAQRDLACPSGRWRPGAQLNVEKAWLSTSGEMRALPPGTPIRCALEDRSLVPEWWPFDPERRLFHSTAVPAGGLPLTVAVTIRGVRTLVRVVALN